jgi:hypothetical protein
MNLLTLLSYFPFISTPSHRFVPSHGNRAIPSKPTSTPALSSLPVSRISGGGG